MPHGECRRLPWATAPLKSQYLGLTLVVLISTALAETNYKCASSTSTPTQWKVTSTSLQYKWPPDSEWQDFTWNGIGYSPIPPGDTATREPFGDYYTLEHKHLWRRDLTLMREMGVTVIRLWHWNFLGTSIHNHGDFLDEAWNNGTKPIYVLIPFDMGRVDVAGTLLYRDLRNAETRRLVLSDWSALIQRYRLHPAVLGFLVGNELDNVYNLDQWDALFSVVNIMMAVVRDVEGEPHHPVTVPLSELNFMKIVKLYYAYVAIDYWSVQIYDPDSETLSTYKNFINEQEDVPKRPIALTEYGHDSLRTPEGSTVPVVDEDYQWEQVKKMLTETLSAEFVLGHCLMEWVDEWWKSFAPDFRDPRCPNELVSEHTYCANYITKEKNNELIAIHEEWLGIFNQSLPDETSYTGLTRYCITPKRAYYELAALWGGTAREGEQCAEKRSANPLIWMAAPMALAVFIELFYLRCCRRGRHSAGAYKQNLVVPIAAASLLNGEQPMRSQVRDLGADRRRIEERVRAVFYPFLPTVPGRSTPTTEAGNPFLFAERRLVTAIWDHLASFDPADHPQRVDTDELIDGCIRFVYIKQMEGYYTWLQQGKVRSEGLLNRGGIGHPEPQDSQEMLGELALYSIVTQCAGTINHAPERTMQVFHFTKNYLEELSLKDPEGVYTTTTRNIQVLLLEVFRIFYCYIDERLTLDDINDDASNFKPLPSVLVPDERLSQEFYIPELSQFTPQRYSQVRSQVLSRVMLTPMSPFSEAFFTALTVAKGGKRPAKKAQKPRAEEKQGLVVSGKGEYGSIQSPTGVPDTGVGVELPDLRRTFTQRGGVPTTIYNCGWVIRMVLWLSVLAWYFEPAYLSTAVCFSDATAYLALMDAWLMVFLELCHLRLFLGRLLSARHVFTFLIYTGCAVALTAVTLGTVPDPFVLIGLDHLTLDVIHLSLDITIPTIYLCAVIAFGVLRESYRFAAIYSTPLPGRLRLFAKGFWEGFSSGIVLGMLASAVLAFLFRPPWAVIASGIPTLTLGGGMFLGAFWSKSRGSREQTKRELVHVFNNFVFWAVIIGATFYIFYSEIIPTVIKVRVDTLCSCPSDEVALTREIKDRCKLGRRIMCTLAVAMTWATMVIINFVWVWAVFQVMLLVYGIGRGKRDRVGNVKDWTDVQRYFAYIKGSCLPSVSASLCTKKNQMRMWNAFVKALYKEFLISLEEYNDLKITARLLNKGEPLGHLDEVEDGRKYSNPIFLKAPQNPEAQRRVIYFLWSLQALAARNRQWSERDYSAKDLSPYRQSLRVIAMPSLTVMTPCYAEPVLFSVDELRNPYHRGQAASRRQPRISVLEYLVSLHIDEWENFCSWLKQQREVLNESFGDGLRQCNQNEILRMFLEEDERLMGNPPAVLHIRLWASFRGQTLGRLIKGLHNWRDGIRLMASLENSMLPQDRRMTEEQLDELVSWKFQILICHQIYGLKGFADQTADMDLIRNTESLGMNKFDLVSIADNDSAFRSRCSAWTPDGTEEFFVLRPGPLRPNPPCPTEPKAENQNHGLPFTYGQVIATLDMNQYATIDDAFKLPFMLNCYFGTKSAVLRKGPYTANDVVARFRIVGYAEHQFTRHLSMIGEVAGQAEYCFVTIHQRVLRWPLRVRLHYGHPDFMDGYWVRTRGGLSKCNYLVNTAEDVFSGYEIVGRGERIEYIEWVQVQKGKESALTPAFLFERKLAQASAQQMRSRDIYRLNAGSNVFIRLGLFFGGYGFFIFNTLLAMSIHMYVISISLFVGSGVTDHDLGVNLSSLAVPWVFQVGFMFSFPLIIELWIEKGVVKGVIHFIKTLPFALVYHIFQMQTRAFFFLEGLFRGKGGYIASSRGYGLDRMTFVEIYTTYATSHIHPAINLLFWSLLYSLSSSGTTSYVLLRLLFMLFVVFCWIGAPIIYNPFPTTHHLGQDIDEMYNWLHGVLPSTEAMKHLLLEQGKREDVAKGQTKRRDGGLTTKDIRDWVQSQRSVSWMAWYIHEEILGPWGDEEQWFLWSGLLVQKVVRGLLTYTPWLAWASFGAPLSFDLSVWVAIPVGLTWVYFTILDYGLPQLHSYFNILKTYVPMAIIGITIYFLLSWRINTRDLILSMVFYFIAYAVALDILLGLFNFKAKRRVWRRQQAAKRTQADEDSIYLERLSVPRYYFTIQKVYPVLALVFFVIINWLCCLFAHGLTSLLYSPIVAAAWARATNRPPEPPRPVLSSSDRMPKSSSMQSLDSDAAETASRRSPSPNIFDEEEREQRRHRRRQPIRRVTSEGDISLLSEATEDEDDDQAGVTTPTVTNAGSSSSAALYQ